jgi:hypothetical protein
MEMPICDSGSCGLNIPLDHLQQCISEMSCNRSIAVESVVRVLPTENLAASDVCGQGSRV